MLLTEKKIRSIIRKILLEEVAFDPTDVTKSFDLDKAIELARKLVLKDSVKKNEKDKEESIKISKSLAAISDGVPGEPTQRFQTALANLLNFEGPGKEEKEYKDLLKMVKDRLGSQAKKGDGQSEKDPIKKKKSGSNPKIKEIQEKLNSLNFKNHKGESLTPDGKWGRNTRSAVSKMLKMINDASDGPTTGLFTKLNLNSIPDDPLFGKLATGSKGPGSWKKLSIKLVNTTSFDIQDKYDAVIAILVQMAEKNVNKSKKTDDDSRELEQSFPNEMEDKYPDLNKKAPNKFINLLNVKKGSYKTPSNTPSVTISAKQRFNITNPEFKNTLIDGPDFSGKKKGSYMLSLTMDKNFGMGRSTFDIYYLGGKTGSLRLDGPQFYNYQINGYAKLADGSLVPKDYADSLEK